MALERGPLGSHHLLDMVGIEGSRLDDPVFLESCLEEAARGAGAHIVGRAFHHFSPQGVTGILLLAESHVAIHTWPERGEAAIDVFTCADPKTGHRIAELIIARLEPIEYDLRSSPRGIKAGVLA